MIINIDEINTDNILYYKPDNFLTINHEIGIYNYHKDNEIKIIFQLCPVIINKINKLSIEINLKPNVRINNDKDIKKLKTFIKKIDKINETVIEEKKVKWKLPLALKYQSSLTSNDIIMFEVPYDIESGYHLQIFDFNDDIITLDQLKVNDYVIGMVELSHLYFDGNKYGTKWIIHQIQKVYPISPIQRAINKNKIIKVDSYNISNIVKNIVKVEVEKNFNVSIGAPPPPPPPPPKINNTNRPQLFCPSVSDLHNVMNSLKKVEKKVEKENETEDDVVVVKKKKKK